MNGTVDSAKMSTLELGCRESNICSEQMRARALFISIYNLIICRLWDFEYKLL